MCEPLVGLPAAMVLGVVDAGPTAPLRVQVEMRGRGPRCGCGTPPRLKERPSSTSPISPVFGHQTAWARTSLPTGSGRHRVRWGIGSDPEEKELSLVLAAANVDLATVLDDVVGEGRLEVAPEERRGRREVAAVVGWRRPAPA